MIARIWRQGQPSNRVFIHRLIAERTMDFVVTRTLLHKGAVADDFSNAMKEMRSEASEEV
jgi:hypothetical protein